VALPISVWASFLVFFSPETPNAINAKKKRSARRILWADAMRDQTSICGIGLLEAVAED
jgi:hypothetical protein